MFRKTLFKRAQSLLLAALIAAVSLSAAAEGVPAPDFALKRPGGETVRLSELRGQVVVVVFWATWCPYCKRLLPGIQKLINGHTGAPLKVLAVDILDEGDPVAYMKSAGYTMDLLVQGDAVAKTWGVQGTPTVFVVNPAGRVIYVTSNSDPENKELTDAVDIALRQVK
jgi:peroxiredoxin